MERMVSKLISSAHQSGGTQASSSAGYNVHKASVKLRSIHRTSKDKDPPHYLKAIREAALALHLARHATQLAESWVGFGDLTTLQAEDAFANCGTVSVCVRVCACHCV